MRLNCLLALVFVLLLLLCVADVAIGSVYISFQELLSFFGKRAQQTNHYLIIKEFRLPKMCTAVLAGAALSVSGLQMQTLFRNPLAGPYVLGISSGASLGVAVVVLGENYWGVAPWSNLWGSWLTIGAAVNGAVIALLVMMQIAARLPAGQNTALLIAGLMLGSAVSALVGLLEYFSSSEELQRYVMWGFGSLTAVDWQKMQVLAPVIATALMFSMLYFKPLDMLHLGEVYAQTAGLDVRKVRRHLVLLSGLLAGSITAFCGPIGFIGLAVPQMARLLSRTSRNNVLLPLSALLGACVLLFCDILCYLPPNGQVLPINVITSLIGAPVVIWLVLRARR
ncbi:MAG: iron ABC transporter permease [Cytophagales bacterium]|nr:iron ABC transporter permease [Bernardetiaceae bacterium]MDW8204784.1 iron ABC transporter permease [Cytophagales bacterium]